MEQGAQLSDERKQYHSTDKLRAFQVYKFSSVRRVVLKYQSDFPTTFDSLPLYAGEGRGLGVNGFTIAFIPVRIESVSSL